MSTAPERAVVAVELRALLKALEERLEDEAQKKPKDRGGIGLLPAIRRAIEDVEA